MLGEREAELPKGLSNHSCARLAVKAGLVSAPRLVQGGHRDLSSKQL